MALQDWEKFRGVADIRRDNFNQNLLYGFLDWLKWSTLQVGGFQNVQYAYASGIFGGDFSRLRLVDEPNYTDGQVWEGFRSDWVWETGVTYSTNPRECSGVYVNGTFYPTASETGVYEHTVNYPLGRVVFTTALPTTSVVHSDYSHRTISYVRASEPWFRELLFDSYRVDRDDFLAEGSGQWDQLAMTRRHMPVVAVELSTRRFEPYEIGGSAKLVYQDVIMYVLSEGEDDRNQIVDILSQQHDKTIWLYNRGRIKEGTDFLGNPVSFPYDLDMNGSPISSPLQFPDLVAATGDGGFQYRKVVVGDMRVQVMDQVYQGRLYRGVLRTTFEGIV
jgi:hypothetical protein